MTRLIFPDEGSRLVYRVSGTAMRLAPGVAVAFYADAAATVLADLRAHDGTTTPGAVIAGSVLSTDAYSRLPLFWGPDTIDTLYAVVTGGPASAVYARVDDRLDALGASVATNTGGIATEATARVAGDATNATAITTEATTRAAADTTLTTNVATNTAGLAAELTARAAGDALSAQKSANLSDLASAATARTNLGLGTAATSAATAYDVAGAAAAVATNLTTETTNRVAGDATNATAAAAAQTTASAAYVKPGSGIPSTDMTAAVRAYLATVDNLLLDGALFPSGNYGSVQAAIDAAAAAGGGVVTLPVGGTPVAAAIQMKNKVVLTGPEHAWSTWGYNGTPPTPYQTAWLEADSSTTDPAVRFAPGVYGAALQNIMVHAPAMRIGVSIDADVTTRGGNRLHSVYTNGGSVGIYVGQKETHLRDILAMNAAGDGVQIDAQDCEWESGVVGYCGANGVVLTTLSGPIRMGTLDTFFNTLVGLVINGAAHRLFSVQADNNGREGIKWGTATNGLIVGVNASNNSREFATSGIRYDDVSFAHPAASNSGCGIIGGQINNNGTALAAVGQHETIVSFPLLQGIDFGGTYSAGGSSFAFVPQLTSFRIHGCVNVPDVAVPQGGLAPQFRPNGPGDLVQATNGSGVVYWAVAATGQVYDKTLGLCLVGDPRIGAVTAVWSGANRCVYARVISGGFTISKIGLEVGTASGNISVAVYRNSGSGRAAVPGTQLATSGSVACPAAGYAEVALGSSVMVYPGDWLAMSCDNTTATFNRWASATGSDVMLGLVRRQDTAHPAPSPVGTLAASSSVPVLCGVP